MLTQSAPAIIQTLSGVLSPAAVQQLTQALANCRQPLSHRGPANFIAPGPNQSGPGYVSGGRWNPLSPEYAEILGLVDDTSGTDVDIPGWAPPGGQNSYNYFGDNFSFPLNQEFTINNYNGGPNIYNSGDIYNTNTYSETVTSPTINAGNINTDTINNIPVPGGGGGGGGGGFVGGFFGGGFAGDGFVFGGFGGQWGGQPQAIPGAGQPQPQRAARVVFVVGAKGDKGDKGDTGSGGGTYDKAFASTTSITYVTNVFCNTDGTIGKSTATATVVTGITYQATPVA